MTTTVTRTVKSAGGDYSTLLAYEAGEQGDLPTLDEIRQAECYAFLDQGLDPLFDGWTTDATRYIRVFAAAGEQHNGTRGTGYRRQIRGFGHGVDIREDFMRVEGVAVESDDNGGTEQWGDRGFHIEAGVTTDIRISKCYQTVGRTNDFAFARIFGGGVIKIWNCVSGYDEAVGNSANQLDVADAGVALSVYNNTFVGTEMSALGFFGLIQNTSGGAPLVVCKNNLCDRGANPGANPAAYMLASADTTGSTNNLSDDATAPGANPLTNKAPEYVDEVNGDLHIAVADAVCRDVGADLSGDGTIPFSDDIDGDARPIGAAWDVGADESAGPPPVRPLRVISSPLRW